MDELIEIRAIVRLEMLDRVVRRLKDSGVPRLTVVRCHAIGTGRRGDGIVSLHPVAEVVKIRSGSRGLGALA